MLSGMKNIWFSLAILALAACDGGSVRQNLGLDRAAPDEFRVVSRPPLSVPPEFTLRPPMPGEPPLGVPQAETQAKSLILKNDGDTSTRILQLPSVETAVDPVQSGELTSSAESSFLSKAGTSAAEKEIRSTLIKEAKEEPETTQDVSPLESWLGIGSADPVVDPKGEAERLRENKDAGKPVNEGEVKTEDSAKKSVIDKILE
jgi:hypothetical protein